MQAYKYKNERKTLGDASIGNVVTIGGRDYVVLDHRYGATAVITDESVAFIPYGSSPVYAERVMFVHSVMASSTRNFAKRQARTTSYLIWCT